MRIGLFLSIIGIILLILGAIRLAYPPYLVAQIMVALSLPCIACGYIRVMERLDNKKC